MAEKQAESQAAATPPNGNPKPILFIALAVINMVVVAAVGLMLFQNKKKEANEPKLEHVIKGEAETQKSEASEENSFIGRVVPLETFVVNIAATKGRKVAKVNIEIELKGDNVAAEIEKRKAQVRDIIIIILSSKTYDEVSTMEGKEALREEIKEQLNSFLATGKISNVYFTEFIYN